MVKKAGQPKQSWPVLQNQSVVLLIFDTKESTEVLEIEGSTFQPGQLVPIATPETADLDNVYQPWQSAKTKYKGTDKFKL